MESEVVTHNTVCVYVFLLIRRAFCISENCTSSRSVLFLIKLEYVLNKFYSLFNFFDTCLNELGFIVMCITVSSLQYTICVDCWHVQTFEGCLLYTSDAADE